MQWRQKYKIPDHRLNRVFGPYGVADLDLVDHEAHGSAYAEMLAHGIVVEVCEVSEFGHTNRSSRIGDRAKEAMAGRIPRRPRAGLRPSCGTSPRRSSSVCQNYM